MDSHQKNLYIIVLDQSEIETSGKTIIIHGASSKIKLYNKPEQLIQAIQEKKWPIYSVFDRGDVDVFSTGDICFCLEILNLNEIGNIIRIVSKNGKVGWIREQCLYKINTKKYKFIEVCECLE
jgi:hypothetical protein